jgi:hypothetical protein
MAANYKDMKPRSIYVARLPKKIPQGWVLRHNPVVPILPLGVNGFRAWLEPDNGHSICRCAWCRNHEPSNTCQCEWCKEHVLHRYDVDRRSASGLITIR